MHNLTAAEFLELIDGQLPNVQLLKDAPVRVFDPTAISVWVAHAPLPDGCDAQILLGNGVDCPWYARVTQELYDFLLEAL